MLHEHLLVHERRNLVLEAGNKLYLCLELRNKGGLLLKEGEGLELALKDLVLRLDNGQELGGGLEDRKKGDLLLQHCNLCFENRNLLLKRGGKFCLYLKLRGGLTELCDRCLERKGCGGCKRDT